MKAKVIGGGFAGCEACYQLLKRGWEVTLAEIWQELEQLTALSPQEGMAAEQEVEKALCRGNPCSCRW